MREVVIVDSVRTGLAKSFRGKFNLTRPDDMAAHCVDALLARNDLDPLLVDDCIVGAGSNRRRPGPQHRAQRGGALRPRHPGAGDDPQPLLFLPACRRSPSPPTRSLPVAAR